MLVLARKPGESIVIGNDIVITVLEIRGGQIRLGVDAPRSLQVHREEIYRQVSEANADAVASTKHPSTVLQTTIERAREARTDR